MEWISVGGLRLRVLIRGEGLPILFLHGFGGRIESFLPVMEELERDYQVIALDLPGFGMSDEPRPLKTLLSAERESRELLGCEDGGDREERESFAFGTAEYAQVIELLLDALKVRSAGIVAHSFGGRVALDFAARCPERVHSMILCDSAGVRPRRGPGYYFRVLGYKLRKRLGLRTEGSGSEDYRSLSPSMRATFVKTVNQDCRGYLHRIDCPVLLVWGENDEETPLYMARAIKAGIRDCELIVFSDCGHFAYLDQTYRFNCIAKSFFQAPDAD